jgi:hypothetical protein
VCLGEQGQAVGYSHVSTESEVYHEQKSYTDRKFPLLDILFGWML